MLMLDFGALPPEINSARMYAGPGPGPMLTAAAAWDAVAAQLESFGTAYSSMLAELQGESWCGGASTAMAAAAAPYAAWAITTAGQAGQAASQARAAAAAFEAAFAATVPPAVVAANRTLLATLVMTNFFGQNTPAIAATEASYAEMWAQDAAAMYGYAASASAAATLAPFSRPPQTTNPGGQSGQGSAVTQAVYTSAGQSQTTLSQLMSALPQQLQILASGGSSNASVADSSAASTSAAILTAVGDFDTLIGPLNLVYQVPYTVFQGGSFATGLLQSGVQAKDLPEIAEENAEGAAAAARTLAPEGVRAPALASVGRAVPIGRLSVPQNWTTPTPAPSLTATEPVAAEPGFRVLPPWANPPNTPAGMPTIGKMTNGAGHRGGNAVFRMRDRRYRIPRPALGG
jgi:PPE-repeat protein